MLINPATIDSDSFQRLLRSGHARMNFSQLGEDAIIWHHLHARKGGFYVDVGCHHPLRFSNTANLHNFYSWSGINIDVDPALIAEFEKQRPLDINLCLAVGPERKSMEVTFFEEPAVNSLDPATVEEFKRHFKPVRSEVVDVVPLKDILDEHVPDGKAIDLMSVDVEGLDYEVLCSNDWKKYRPDVLIVEAHKFNLSNPGDNPTFQLLNSEGYRLDSHCVVSSIYVKR